MTLLKKIPRSNIDLIQVNIMSLNNLCELMNIINREQKHSIINILVDLLKLNVHSKTENYLENIFTGGFLPTRVTPSTATLIDHIYTNDISNTDQSGIIITDVADYFGVFYISKNKQARSIQYKMKKRIITEDKINKFKENLSKIDFSSIHQIMCPNEAYSKFIEIYSAEFDKSFPLVDFTAQSKNIKREPWFTSALFISSKTKSKLFSKKHSKPTEHNIKIYKDYNKVYNKLKREMKRNYYNNIIVINENKHDIKKTWKILRKATGKLNDKSSFPSYFTINNSRISNKENIAETFNNFFSQIGLQTGHNVPKSNTSFKSYLPDPIPHSIFIEPVSPSDVTKAALKSKTQI